MTKTRIAAASEHAAICAGGRACTEGRAEQLGAPAGAPLTFAGYAGELLRSIPELRRRRRPEGPAASTGSADAAGASGGGAGVAAAAAAPPAARLTDVTLCGIFGSSRPRPARAYRQTVMRIATISAEYMRPVAELAPVEERHHGEDEERDREAGGVIAGVTSPSLTLYFSARPISQIRYAIATRTVMMPNPCHRVLPAGMGRRKPAASRRTRR